MAGRWVSHSWRDRDGRTRVQLEVAVFVVGGNPLGSELPAVLVRDGHVGPVRGWRGHGLLNAANAWRGPDAVDRLARRRFNEEHAAGGGDKRQ